MKETEASSMTHTATSGMTRRDLLLNGGSALGAASAASVILPLLNHPLSAAQASEPPNILYILADDLGWKDVGFHGSDIRTPNLDRLAEGGALLDQFYVQPMCTPTRAALMTGRYPCRYGLQTGVIPSAGTYGLATDEWLLPQALKEAGYRTALIGKWHLGHAKTQYWPRQRGFDYFYGPLVGEIDHFKHEAHGKLDWYRNNELVHEAGYDTNLFGADAVRLIREHDPKTPLFLYLAFTAPHTPYQAPEKYLAMYESIADPSRRAYAAMITAMDEEVGNVIRALEERHLRQNTLIVFHSDNGGTRSAMFAGEGAVSGNLPPDNGPYRDGKGTLYEGGTRAVALANWPGFVSPGRVDQMIHVVDMYPTLVALGKAKLGKSNPLDGVDVWPVVSAGAPSPRDEIVYNVEPFGGAVRQDEFKLLWLALLPSRVELFDVVHDPSEKTNLAEQKPETVEKLQARIEEIAREMAQPLLLLEAIRLTFGAPLSTPTQETYFLGSD